MRILLLLAVSLALFSVTRLPAGNLGELDRTIRKEPVYQSKTPLYCLLVFGKKAETRVWVVLDEDVLYVDRNGNGDLTDPGERIAAREVSKNLKERPDVEVMRTFERACWKEGDEPILTCGPEVQWFYIHQLEPRADWHDTEWVRMFQERPFDVAVTTKAGNAQRARVRFTPEAQTAPVVPYDGPRGFELSKRYEPQVFRPGEPCELAIELSAPGLNAWVRTDHDDVPDNVHPVAEIEFPRADGGDPIRLRVELKDRC